MDIGSVTITASSPVYTTGSQTALVTGVVTPSPSSLSITGIGSANLTLTLNVSAPSGGVTINLSSSNTSIAIVPATATFQPGSNTVVVPVNSVNVGSATITASLLPSIPNATAAVTVSPAGTLSLGPAVSVTVGQSGALALSVSPAAPVGGVTVNLASSNTSLAAVTPSIVVIPAGQTTPSTQPQVNANGVGNVSITATAPGFTAATPVTAAVNDTVSFPSTTTIIQLPAKATSFTQNIPLTVAVPMPVAVTLNLSSSNPNVATVPSTVTIPANATTVQVPVTGISGAGGAVTIHANKTPNIPDVTASVFVKNPPVGTITIAPVSVGQGLEAQITVTLSSPQMTDTNVPIYTSDPTKALIAGRVADPGTPSVIATVAAGTTSAGGIYVQGLVSSGTVQIYTLTTNFVDANTTVTLQPAGFVLSGPNPIGNQTFATGQGTTTTLTVSAAMLNSSLDFVAVQPVANNGSTPTVNVTSSNTSIGAITASPVTFTAGASSETTSFVAAGTSATSAATVTLSVSVPSGFSMPADDNSLTATVNGTGMTTSNVSVGNGLETQATVTLNGNATVSTVVTITSPSSSVLFSATSTGTGAQSLTLTIPPQFSHTPPFYVYGKANSGTVTYTVSAPNFNPASGTVTLQPAGFVMQGPLGLGSSSFPASLGTTQGITVIAAMLNASGGYVAQQAVAGPNSVTINLTSSNTAVGTITSPVVIAGGTSNSIATFTPVGPGTSSITMSTPGGFSTPSVDTQLNATIAPQSVQVTTGVTVGNQLALQGTVNLSQAPSSNETVTLTATGNILLAVNPTDAGSGSIQITITAGSTQGNYYIYGLANSGTATYSATASGYTNGSGTVTLAPSGVVIAGPNGLGAPVTTNAATPVTLTLYTGTLDPTHSNNFSNIEQLAGFVTSGVTVTIDDLSGGAYGTLSPNPVTIPAGANSGTETFTPSGDSGNVPFTLQVVTPTGGFTTAHSDASVQMAVNN